MSMKLIFISVLATLSFAAGARGISSPMPASPEELHNLASTDGCSAGLVNIGRSHSAQAVVVTNGHCIERDLKANMVLLNLPSTKSFSIFKANGSKVSVKATRLLYATLMDTDIAFYELRETNAQLAALGLKAFPIYSGQAPLGSSVRVTSGYWKETQRCTIERRIHKILEGFGADTSHPSVATDAFALSSSCNIRGGYSGTPIIDEATETIIAMAFTGAEGSIACIESSPCEIDESGTMTYRRGLSYAARVDQIDNCLVDGEFNLALPTCSLYK